MTEEKEIKRTYNIPLRSGFRFKAKHKRAKVCIRVVKDFLKKHMKSEDIRLGKQLNEDVWKHGMKNPPHHIKVDVIKDKEGIVKAELFGHKYIDGKKEEKKESIKDRIMSKIGGPEKTIVKKDKVEESSPAKKDDTIKKYISSKKVEVEEKPSEPKVVEKTVDAKIDVKSDAKVEEKKEEPKPSKDPVKKDSTSKESTEDKKTD